MPQEARTLHVDIDEIITARETDGSGNMSAFLDLETGKVRYHFADMDGRLFEDDEELSASRVTNEQPDPGADFVREYRQNPARFLDLPRLDSHEIYELMCAFAESVDEEDIVEKLALALRGKGAFGRFRDVVFRYPDLSDRWHTMHRDHCVQETVSWLESNGIHPIYEVPAPVSHARDDKACGVKSSQKPRALLLHVLLLGEAAEEAGPRGFRVVRQVVASTPSEARGIFKTYARELAEMKGVAWRKRFIENTNEFTLDDITLEQDGVRVRVLVDVPKEVYALFRSERS